MAVLLAFVVLGGSYFAMEQVLPSFMQSALLGSVVFVLLYHMLVNVSQRASQDDGSGPTSAAG